MDWTIKPYAEANHPPKPALGHADRLTARLGDRVELSASGSSDPDSDQLSYEWFVYGEAGSFTTSNGRNGILAEIENAQKEKATLIVPKQRIFRTGDIHVILAVSDNGTPKLTRYKRVIVEVTP